MKVGVFIEPWKLTIFKRRLDAAGYSYTETLDGGFVTLSVEVDQITPLQRVIEAAQRECKMS